MRLTTYSLLLTLLLFTTRAFGAVAVDGYSDPGSSVVGDTISFTSHTIGGSNRFALAFILIGDNAISVSAVSCGALSFSFLASESTVAGSYNHIEVWKSDSEPATGTCAFSTTLSGVPTYSSFATLVSFSGVNQSVPLGAPVTSNDGGSVVNSTLINVAGATNGMIVDFFVTGSSEIASYGVGQTPISNIAQTGISYRTDSGTVTMSWSWVNLSSATQIGVLIEPVTAPTAVKHRVIVIQ